MSSPGVDSTQRRRRFRLPLQVIKVSWTDLIETVVPALLLSGLALFVAMHFVRPAPPKSLSISAGPAGSTFHTLAEQYRKVLARNGIELRILESEGSIDNLNRLSNPESGVDVALVQSGITGNGDTSELVSLGSVTYQPIILFYRGREQLHRLSQLAGRRIAVGASGSGTRFLALALLKANGIDPQSGGTRLLDLEGERARSALLNNSADAIFLTSDSASPATIREMLHAPGIRLFDFEQADAYVRRFPYLSKLEVPAGAFDLGENLPGKPINMLAPTVELLSRQELHPVLTDLLIEAAMETNGRASLLANAGQFPSTTLHSFPIGTEAARYYKSGRSLAYRYLPFWLASLVTRAAVVLVPIFVVVIPSLRYLPQLYNWRVRSRIYRRYGELMAIERESLHDLSPERRAALLERVDEIERSTIAGKTPGSHGESVYRLRELLQFVRARLAQPPAAPQAPEA